MLEPLEEAKARALELGKVRAECVARIVVAPGRMPEFVEVLQQNLARYKLSMTED